MMRHYWMRQSSHGETEGYFNGGILIIKSKLKILVHMNRSVKYRGRTLIKCLFFGGGGGQRKSNLLLLWALNRQSALIVHKKEHKFVTQWYHRKMPLKGHMNLTDLKREIF